MRARRLVWYKKLVALSAMGTSFQFGLGSCNLGEFTTTSSVTLSGREVIQFIVQSAILTPINDFLTGRIDAFFDGFEEDGG